MLRLSTSKLKRRSELTQNTRTSKKPRRVWYIDSSPSTPSISSTSTDDDTAPAPEIAVEDLRTTVKGGSNHRTLDNLHLDLISDRANIPHMTSIEDEDSPPPNELLNIKRIQAKSVRSCLSEILQLCPEHPIHADRRPTLSLGPYCTLTEWNQKKDHLPVATKLWFTQQWIRRKAFHKRCPEWRQILKESGCDSSFKRSWLSQYEHSTSNFELWDGLTLKNLSKAADLLFHVFESRITNTFKRSIVVVGPRGVNWECVRNDSAYGCEIKPTGRDIIHEKWIDLTKGELRRPGSIKKFEPLDDLVETIKDAAPNYDSAGLNTLLAATIKSGIPSSSIAPMGLVADRLRATALGVGQGFHDSIDANDGANVIIRAIIDGFLKGLLPPGQPRSDEIHSYLLTAIFEQPDLAVESESSLFDE